jgi:hypothetical protein
VSNNTPSVALYAYAEEKDVKKTPASSVPKVPTQADKRLRYSTSLSNNEQDLLSDLMITFNKPLKIFDSTKIILTDTNYNRISHELFIDSNRKNIDIKAKWIEASQYRLIINKDIGSDSTGLALTRSDTLRFNAKKVEDYGNIVLRFSNVDTAKHPV